MRFLARAGKRALSTLWLPLSLIPMVLGIPLVVDQYESFAKHYLNRKPLDPVEVSWSGAQKDHWATFPAYENAVPVLAYHGVNDEDDHFSVSRRAFAEQMAMLKDAGFNSIGIQDYARFIVGAEVDLPDKPILITFDDSRLDSYRGADRILEHYGMRATMFTITRTIDERNAFYVTWKELREMHDSGRWDIQPHAGDGHRHIPYDAAGHRGPFYAYREWKDGRLESLGDYMQRVTADIMEADRRLEEHLPGYHAYAFAPPYGNYGQNETNDSRAASQFITWLADRYDAILVQDNPRFNTPQTPRWRAPRFELHTSTTADDLFNTLRDAVPGVNPPSPQTAARPAHPSRGAAAERGRRHKKKKRS